MIKLISCWKEARFQLSIFKMLADGKMKEKPRIGKIVTNNFFDEVLEISDSDDDSLSEPLNMTDEITSKGFRGDSPPKRNESLDNVDDDLELENDLEPMLERAKIEVEYELNQKERSDSPPEKHTHQYDTDRDYTTDEDNTDLQQ
jgi:hypothetical protein